MHFCAGAILNVDWIITAGDCVDSKRPPEIYALTGSVNATFGPGIYHIELAVIHPNYTALNASNNLALLSTTRPMILNDFTQPIEINRAYVFADETTTLTGWGSTKDSNGPRFEILRWVNHKTILNRECRRRMPTPMEDAKTWIYASSLCIVGTVGRDTCIGDMGSPLTVNGKLFGVHLWSIDCTTDYPDIFTRVFAFRDWIRNMMKAEYASLDNSKCVCRTPSYCICKRDE